MESLLNQIQPNDNENNRTNEQDYRQEPMNAALPAFAEQSMTRPKNQDGNKARTSPRSPDECTAREIRPCSLQDQQR